MSAAEQTLRAGRTGEPIELARYRISAGERIIRGQRIRGVVRLSDVPAHGNGRRFVIERELTSLDELQAIVDDYLCQAALWDDIPALPCWLPSREKSR
jgi:hypothetical protein